MTMDRSRYDLTLDCRCRRRGAFRPSNAPHQKTTGLLGLGVPVLAVCHVTSWARDGYGWRQLSHMHPGGACGYRHRPRQLRGAGADFSTANLQTLKSLQE